VLPRALNAFTTGGLPALADDSVLLPFPRLFVVAVRWRAATG